MSALKSLNFVAVPKQAGNDPVQARRAKLITQLEQQRELSLDEHYVVKRQKWVKQEDGSKALVDRPKRVKRWWRTDGSGNCFLILRYGNKVLSPTPDKGAIAVGDKAKLPEVLEAVISAVRAGELDTAMVAAKAIDPARGVKKKIG
ncbi:MAG: DUF6641 family protein [Hyphomicrobiales bacterium]